MPKQKVEKLGKNARLPSREDKVNFYEELSAAGYEMPEPGEEIFKAWLKEKAEAHLYFFSKWILGFRKLGPLHDQVCTWLSDLSTFRHKLLMLPVGHLKTTIVSHSLPTWLIIQPSDSTLIFPQDYSGGLGRNSRIVLGAENQKKASENLQVNQEILETNPWIVWLWPECVWNDKNDSPRWNNEDLVVPRTRTFREATISAYGVENAITGGHFDAILPDDIATIKAGQSVQVMEGVKTWLKRSYTRLHDRFSSIHIGIGTHQGTDDVYLEWEKRPGVETLKKAIEEKDEDGKLIPIWPEEWTPDKITKLKDDTDSITLSLWYYNRPVASGFTALDWQTLREFRWVGGSRTGIEQPFGIEFEEDSTDAEFKRIRESLKNPLTRFANGMEPIKVRGNREQMIRRFFGPTMSNEQVQYFKDKYGDPEKSPAQTPGKDAIEWALSNSNKR